MATANIATTLPDVTLLPGSTVEVDAGAGGTVRGLTIHGFKVAPPPRPPKPKLLPGLSGDRPSTRTTQGTGGRTIAEMYPGINLIQIEGPARGPYIESGPGNANYIWDPNAARVPAFGGLVVSTNYGGVYSVVSPDGSNQGYIAPEYDGP